MASFEYGALSDEQKLDLCRTLLEEFGANNIKVMPNGEMIHSCVLPFGGHPRGDRSPSASLNYRKLTYNCLGCGSSGGLLWFIGVCRGTSSTDARKWLGGKTGKEGGVQELADLLSFFDGLYAEQQLAPPIPKMDPSVLKPWMFIHPYLTEMRGIPRETVVRFKVGFNVDAQRIVIPHFWKDKLVGWQTRRLVKDDTPKYQSSPDFPKSRTIYNYDTSARSAIIVESPMSVLSKYHITHNIEATFGAKVTDEQIRLLKQHPQVVLFFDNDMAGWSATQKVGEALTAYCDVWVADNPYNADAADLDQDAYCKALNTSVPYSVWRLPGRLEDWPPEVEVV